MGMSVGGSKGADVGAEYRSADRRAAGADHHLHGDHAGTPTGCDTWFRSPLRRIRSRQSPIDSTIVVQVTAGGKVMINQDQSNWDDLGPRLFDIFKERADKIAFVKGDDNVEFAQVARAIDIMRGAGIDHVGLITAKIEAGQ